MEWFRWYHGSVSDLKFRLVAKKSGQPVAFVVAVWAALLECASQAEDRGDVSSFDFESVDDGLGIADGTSKAIFAALVERKCIQGTRIAKWEVRQPEKENKPKTDKERKQAQRQRERKPGCRHPDRAATIQRQVVRESWAEVFRGDKWTVECAAIRLYSGSDNRKPRFKRSHIVLPLYYLFS